MFIVTQHTVKTKNNWRTKRTHKNWIIVLYFQKNNTVINLYCLVVKCETYNNLTWRSWSFKTRFKKKIFVLFFLFSPTISQAKINCSHNPISAVVGDCWPFDRCQVMIASHLAYDQDEVDWDFQFFLIAERPHSKNTFQALLFCMGSKAVRPGCRTLNCSIFKIFYTW